MMQPTKIDVEVKRLDGKRVKFPNLVSSVDIGCLKLLVEHQWDLKPCDQRFIYAQETLDDARTLGSLICNRGSGPLEFNLVPSSNSLRQSSNGSDTGKEGREVTEVKIRRIRYEDLKELEPIGTGSFKSVHRGQFRSHKEIAILKFRHKGSERAAISEAKWLTILTDLKHPNLLVFYGLSTDPQGLRCIVSEYAKQGSLDNVLDRLKRSNKKLDNSMLIQAAEQIRCGMDATVKANILHRDLSLRNIVCFECNLKTNEIVVKICDFGRARTGPVVLSPGEDNIPTRWCAPEVLSDGIYSEASEIWSYGVTVWEIVNCGKLPFESQDDIETKILKCKGGRLLPLESETPPALILLMKECWEDDPNKRPTFQKLRDYLTSKNS